jgi:hypothetical protein
VTTENTDPSAERAPDTEPAEQAPEGGGETQPEPQDADALMRALRSERELRKAAEKRAKGAERERDDLTERLTTAETERDQAQEKIAQITSARVQDLRAQVAKDAGLNPKIAPRLVGSTREELEADAELIASSVIGNGGGLDGGLRGRTVKEKGTVAQQHGRFIGALLGGADEEEAVEAAEGLWS